MVADAYSCQFSPASITGTLQHCHACRLPEFCTAWTGRASAALISPFEDGLGGLSGPGGDDCMAQASLSIPTVAITIVAIAAPRPGPGHHCCSHRDACRRPKQPGINRKSAKEALSPGLRRHLVLCSPASLFNKCLQTGCPLKLTYIAHTYIQQL